MSPIGARETRSDFGPFAADSIAPARFTPAAAPGA